jgi:hypothetical protein
MSDCLQRNWIDLNALAKSLRIDVERGETKRALCRRVNIHMQHSPQAQSIVSPVSGRISKVGADSIRIYISPNDDHRVFAPIGGRVARVDVHQGRWKRKVFEANVDKIAQTRIFIKDSSLSQHVSFWLEVGYPKYITNRVRIDHGGKVGDVLEQGEQMGEIVLGSLAEVQFNGLSHVNVFQVGAKVTGGETIISYINRD